MAPGSLASSGWQGTSVPKVPAPRYPAGLDLARDPGVKVPAPRYPAGLDLARNPGAKVPAPRYPASLNLEGTSVPEGFFMVFLVFFRFFGILHGFQDFLFGLSFQTLASDPSFRPSLHTLPSDPPFRRFFKILHPGFFFRFFLQILSFLQIYSSDSHFKP